VACYSLYTFYYTFSLLLGNDQIRNVIITAPEFFHNYLHSLKQLGLIMIFFSSLTFFVVRFYSRKKNCSRMHLHRCFKV
jgi:hypothetical protein